LLVPHKKNRGGVDKTLKKKKDSVTFAEQIGRKLKGGESKKSQKGKNRKKKAKSAILIKEKGGALQ